MLCVTREIRYEAVLKAGTGDTAPLKLSSVSLEKKIDTTEEMICPLIRPQLFTLSLHKISYYEENVKLSNLKVLFVSIQSRRLCV